MGKDLPFARIFLVLVGCLVMSGSIYSEDLLNKKESKYLGWQTATNKFTTCKKTIIDIGDGTVERTDKKCEEPPGPGPFVLKGRVKEVNAESRTLVLATPDGKSLTLFYPELSRKEIQDELQDLVRSKREVTSRSPVEGRVDSVKPENKPKCGRREGGVGKPVQNRP